MRGFVLRFNVAAVKTSLEPAKPNEFERSFFNLRPDGYPPYYEQDIKRAELIELVQSEKGKASAEALEHAAAGKKGDKALDLQSGPRAASPITDGDRDVHGRSFDIEEQPESRIIERLRIPVTSSRDWVDRTSEDASAGLSASTLRTNRQYSTSVTPTSPVNEAEFPCNLTHITSAKGQSVVADETLGGI